MRYDYINNRLLDGSPSIEALTTRYRRAVLMIRSGRYSEDECVEYVLRDFPTVARIYAAVDAEVFGKRGTPVYVMHP